MNFIKILLESEDANPSCRELSWTGERNPLIKLHERFHMGMEDIFQIIPSKFTKVQHGLMCLLVDISIYDYLQMNIFMVGEKEKNCDVGVNAYVWEWLWQSGLLWKCIKRDLNCKPVSSFSHAPSKDRDNFQIQVQLKELKHALPPEHALFMPFLFLQYLLQISHGYYTREIIQG